MQTTNSDRLENMPISFFAVVMGLSGLTIAWEKAQHVYQTNWMITPAMVSVTALTFIILFLLYISKIIFHRNAVIKELRHPIKLNFFPAISISLLLLSVASMSMVPEVAKSLWMIGSVLQLIILLYVVNVWIHHTHFEIQHLTPAWFIPAVGNVLVPIVGVPLGYIEISWFFFSIGLLFWIILLTIIFYRMLFHNPINEKLMPTLFILIAPPAIGFVSYTRLVGEADNFGRVLYAMGLFLTLQLLTQAPRFIRLKFFLSWWAYSFPLAAISIASFLQYELTGKTPYLWIASVLLGLLTMVVSILIVKTLNAIWHKRICVEE